jgi:hypothetical protein
MVLHSLGIFVPGAEARFSKVHTYIFRSGTKKVRVTLGAGPSTNIVNECSTNAFILELVGTDFDFPTRPSRLAASRGV